MRTSKVGKYLSEDPSAPRCESLRFDDLASLVAGVKSVVFTSVGGRGEAALLDELCRDLGLRKISLGGNKQVYDGSRTEHVLIGTNAAKIRKAAKSYTRFTSVEWGFALDYPECCVRSYVDWRKRPDRSDLVFHISAASPKKAQFSFVTNNVYNYYSRLHDAGAPEEYASFMAMNRNFDLDPVLPWHPCSYACPSSLAAGRKIYEVLQHYMPHLAEFRRSVLSKPVVFWDKFRFAVLNGTCRVASEGFEVDHKGVCWPVSPLARGVAGFLNRNHSLRVSPAGRVVRPASPRLLGEYVFLPFCPDLPGERPGR